MLQQVICNHLRQAEKSAKKQWSQKEEGGLAAVFPGDDGKFCHSSDGLILHDFTVFFRKEVGGFKHVCLPI